MKEKTMKVFHVPRVAVLPGLVLAMMLWPTPNELSAQQKTHPRTGRAQTHAGGHGAAIRAHRAIAPNRVYGHQRHWHRHFSARYNSYVYWDPDYRSYYIWDEDYSYYTILDDADEVDDGGDLDDDDD